MHVLELRSKSLGSPADLVDVFTSRIHDRELDTRGIRVRTFVRDWGGDYVWTYGFDRPAARSQLIADPRWANVLSAGVAEGLIRAHDVDHRGLRAPVIVLSAPRTGSTLLYELFTNSSELWSIRDESHHVLEALPGLRPEARGHHSHALTADDADPDTVAALRAAFLVHMRDSDGTRYVDRPRDQLRFVEKTPRNAFRIAFLDRLFPDARYIYLTRDPVENLSSMIELWEDKNFHRSINLPGFSGPKGSRWCMLLPPGWRARSGLSTAEIAAFQWKAANDAIVDALTAMSRERWCALSYAQLIEDPAGQMQRLCAFAGIAFEERLATVVAGKLPLSSRTLSAPSRDKAQKHLAVIDPVLPLLRETQERMARLRAAP